MSEGKYKKLRRLAEERLAGQESHIDNMDQADLVRMAHELEVHQVELEIQNEELRRSRVEAERARDLYLDLYDFAPVGYLTLDEHNRIIEANLAVSQVLMETRSHLLKIRFTKFIQPDETQTFHFYRRKVIESEGRQTLELKMLKADGTIFDAQLVSIKTVQERLRIALMDVTERKNTERELNKYKEHLEEIVRERTAELHQSEQNFRNSIENSPLGIRIVTAEGVTLYANRALLDMYGYDTVDELKNSPVSTRYSPESYAQHLKRKEKRKQAAPVPESYDICVKSGDGSLRYLRVHRSEVFWDGRPEFQCIYDDVTDRKRDQEKLKALSRRLLQVQEEERRAMALELHDEIGQSLNALKLLLGRQIRRSDGKFRNALVHLSDLTSDILEQVRQVSLDLRPRMLDDLGLLSALVWYFHRYTDRTGVKVNFQHKGFDRMFSQYVNNQVYRVVQEALTNVSRHAAVDMVEVQAEVDEEILRLKIEDKGKGFDMTNQPISSSVGIEGMRERIRLLGASLTINSAPGHGTRLVLEIPLQDSGMKDG